MWAQAGRCLARLRGMHPVHAVLVCVQVGYAVNHVLMKTAISSGVSELVLCMLRNLLAVLVLIPLQLVQARIRRSKRGYMGSLATWPPLPPGVMGKMCLLGFVGVFMNQVAFTLGLARTSPTVASSLQPSIPVFTFVLAVALGMESLMLRRRDGWAKLLGVVLVVGGALVMALYEGPVVYSRDFGLSGSGRLLLESAVVFGVDATYLETDDYAPQGGPTQATGVLCLIVNCVMMAAFLTLQGKVLEVYPYPVATTAWSYGFGSLFMVGAVILQSAGPADVVWPHTWEATVCVFYAAIIPSAVNVSLLGWANTLVGPATVSMYMTLQPLAASAMSVVFLGYELHLGSILSATLVGSGLYVVAWGRSECQRIEGAGEVKKRDLTGQNSSADSQLSA